MAPDARPPLADLVEVARQKGTGEFICATASVEIHAYLQGGRLAWGTVSTHPLEFGRYLREHARIDDQTYQQVMEECRRSKLPFGETLVAWKLVTQDILRAALCQQVRLAISALADLPSARTMFLPRQHYTRYNPELTFPVAELLPELPGEADALSASPPAAGADRTCFARQIYETIEGAAWVELLEGGRVVEGAPSVRPEPRVPAALPPSTLSDDADFVALRHARGSLVGVNLAGGGRSLWCQLEADSTFGAAAAKLCTLGQDPAAQPSSPAAPRSDAPGWEIGDTAGIAAEEMRSFLGRASELRAMVLLSPQREPEVGVARGVLDAERTLDLVRRRARAFEAPALAGEAAASGSASDPLPSLGFRALVTGERQLWCFGAELGGAHAHTLWMVTDRYLAQGLGWALLAALGRGLKQGGRPA